MTRPLSFRATTSVLSVAALSCGLAALVRSQVPETDVDPNGVAIPYPFVHLVHSAEASHAGTTGWLRANDPFLLYQLGRDLVQRIYTRRQGALDRPGELSVPLYVDRTDHDPLDHHFARLARDHAASCGFCHSMPSREPGSGQTIPSTSSSGRNTPHFFGAGLIEMIGDQVRRTILIRLDANHDGTIDRDEAYAAGRVLVTPAPGEPAVDFGRVKPDAHGVPQLNSAIRVWYVDAKHRVLRGALGFDDPRVAGFDFAVEPFGWGRGWRVHPDGRATSEGGEAATVRGIAALAADIHGGLQADDASQQAPDGLGAARVSLSGAQQFDFEAALDRDAARGADGVAPNAPDRDRHPGDLTEGDLDAIEFYMLHAPAPAVRVRGDSEDGRHVLRRIGCTSCHVERWRIEARDPERGFAGDRRFFRLETFASADADGVPQVAGRLVRTMQHSAHGFGPAARAFEVDRIYSDFKHWDLGPSFWEVRYDGSVQKVHRTAPLWGVGSTRPYGHTGQFDSLDEVIRAHRGDASASAELYASLSASRRGTLLRYLESLVLYPTDEIPVDIDGDGRIADVFRVGGEDVGEERFDAHFLFAITPRYRFVHDVQGAARGFIRLGFITNVTEAFGLDLPYRRDPDRDGFSDALGSRERAGLPIRH